MKLLRKFKVHFLYVIRPEVYYTVIFNFSTKWPILLHYRPLSNFETTLIKNQCPWLKIVREFKWSLPPMQHSVCIMLLNMYIRGFTKFGIKVCIVKATVSGVLEDLMFKIQLNWDSQQGRLRTISILVRASWNF